jgi:hypothetical protein
MPKKNRKSISKKIAKPRTIVRSGGRIHRLALVRTLCGFSFVALANVLRKSFPGLKASASVLHRIENDDTYTPSPEITAALQEVFLVPVTGEVAFADVYSALQPLLQGKKPNA